MFKQGISLTLIVCISCSESSPLPTSSTEVDASMSLPLSDAGLTHDDGGTVDAALDALSLEEALQVPALDAGARRATTSSTEVLLGPAPAGTELSFVVPPNTLGFTITAEAASATSTLRIERVLGPSGSLAMQNARPLGSQVPNGDAWLGTSASVSIPQSFVTTGGAQNPDVGQGPSGRAIAAGTWKFVVEGAPTQARVTFQATPDGVYHGGVLDTVFYIPNEVALPGAESLLDATLAASSPYFSRFVDAFYRTVAYYYGLERGTVQFVPIDSIYGDLSDVRLPAAFALTASSSAAQALHVFVTQSRSQAWLGISPGVPGAQNMRGNIQSAVALAFSSGLGPNTHAFILAHEYGHFSGLNHTSEYRPGLNDPLSDTAECSLYRIEDAMKCAARTNIMFPQAPPQVPVTFSPLQYRVIAGASTYRAFTAGAPIGPGPVLPAPSFAPMFGKPEGAQLTEAEALVALHSCGLSPRPVIRADLRPALQRLRSSDRPAVRNIATRLLQP